MLTLNLYTAPPIRIQLVGRIGCGWLAASVYTKLAACFSGVAKGAQRAQAPQSFRQNINVHINCPKFANLVSLFSGK